VYMKKAFKELYPSNAYLSKMFGLSAKQISRTLLSLSQLHYIIISYERKTTRYIELTKKTIDVFGVYRYSKADGIRALESFYSLWR